MSSNDEEGRVQNENSEPGRSRELGGTAHETTERTPLLANIDPLNKSYVRYYRIVLYIFFACSLVWTMTLVIDSLISLGLPNTYGSGFEVLAISIIGLLNLATSLVFYLTPSPSDRILNLLVVVLLVFDFIIIVTVEQLRHRFGVITAIFAVGGTGGVFLLASLADTIVQIGKEAEVREELEAEEQAAGNVPHEHLFEEPWTHRAIVWFKLITANFLRSIYLIAVVLFSINLVIDASDSHLAPMGTLVAVGGTPDTAVEDATLIHVACTPGGKHGPVILIEAGETSGEEMVGWVQKVDGVKAVCYWDRPGLGFSDNAPSPVGMNAVVSYLEASIEAVMPSFRNESLVLVSHGVGSLYSRVFAAKNMNQVAGLMFVDGLHEQLFYNKETAWRGLTHWAEGMQAPLGLKKLKGLITGQGKSEDRVFGLLEPSQARYHKALLQEQVSANRRSRLDIGLATGALPSDMPLLIISSEKMCKNREWSRFQRLLVELTDNAFAWKIMEGPHALWRNPRSAKDLTRQLSSFIQYLPDVSGASAEGQTGTTLDIDPYEQTFDIQPLEVQNEVSVA